MSRSNAAHAVSQPPPSSTKVVKAPSNVTPLGSLVWKDPKKLVPWGSNPENRVDPSSPALRRLTDSISAEEGVNIPLILWKDGETVLDGHRRRAASITAGIKKVPCVIYQGRKKTIQGAWAETSRTHKAHTGHDWISVFVSTGSREGIPDAIFAHIESLIQLCGKPILKWLVAQDTGPHIIVTVRKIAVSLAVLPDHGLTHEQILKWLVTTNSQAKANIFFSTSPSKDKLRPFANAVKAGKKFKF